MLIHKNNLLKFGSTNIGAPYYLHLQLLKTMMRCSTPLKSVRSHAICDQHACWVEILGELPIKIHNAMKTPHNSGLTQFGPIKNCFYFL